MSLWDDISSFIGKAVGGVEHVVSDVGNAVTGNNQAPQVQQQPQRLQINQPQQVGGIFNKSQGPSPDQQAAMADQAQQAAIPTNNQPSSNLFTDVDHIYQGAKKIANPVVGMGESLGKAALNVGSTPAHAIIGAGAKLVGAKGVAKQQFSDVHQGVSSARQLAQGLPQMAVQLGESVDPVLGPVTGNYTADAATKSYQPKGTLQKLLLGNQPIPSMQNQYHQTEKSGGKLEAASQLGLTSLMDAAAGYGAARGGITAGKVGVNAIKEAPPLGEVGAVGKNVRQGEILKHYTTPETADALKNGADFDYNKAPQHGMGGKGSLIGQGGTTGKFVNDGGPALYLSRDDPTWSKANVPTGKPTIVNIDNLSLEQLKDGYLQKNGITEQYDYAKQKYVGVKNGTKEVNLSPVEHQLDPNARTLDINSPEALNKAEKETGQHSDSPQFWQALRQKYDVVNIKNVSKNIEKAETDSKEQKFFRSAKADQAIVLNPKVADRIESNGLPASMNREMTPTPPKPGTDQYAEMMDNVEPPKLRIKQTPPVKPEDVSGEEAKQYADVFGGTPEQAKIEIAEGQKASQDAVSPKPELVNRTRPTKDDELNNELGVGVMPPESTPEEIAAMDKANPIKVNIAKTESGDYAHARAVPQQASVPIRVAGYLAARAAKRARLTVSQLADMVEHPENHTDMTDKEAKAVDRYRKLTDRINATSHSVGGTERRMTNYFNRNVDTSGWEETRSGIKDPVTGKVYDPKDFQGVNGNSRVLDENGKPKYADLDSLHKAGYKLEGEDNVAKYITNYANKAASSIEKQALKKAFTEADEGQGFQGHSEDMGDGNPLNLSKRGHAQFKGYTQHDSSTIGTLYDKANAAGKHVLLTASQYHPINVNMLTAAPSLILQGHPYMAARGLANTVVSGLSKEHADDLLEKDLDSGQVEDAAKIGMPYGHSDFTASGIGKMGQTVFGRQIPAMYREVANATLKDLEKRKIPLDSQAARDAGAVGNQTMGFVNAAAKNFNPRTQNLLSKIFLAPQFEWSKVLNLKTALDPRELNTLAGRNARAALFGKYAAEVGLQMGIGAATGQKSNNWRDQLIQAAIHPQIATGWKTTPKWKGDPTSNVMLKEPDTAESEIANLFLKEGRNQKTGRLNIGINSPSQILSNVTQDARNKMAPLPATGLKIATNTNYANQPLSDPNAPAGVRAQQEAATLGTDLLPIGVQGLAYTKAVDKHLPTAMQQVLNANKPGTNAVAKSGLTAVGLTPETDLTTGKGLQSQQYYSETSRASSGLNTQEQAALNMNIASKKDPVTGKYVVNPSVWDGPARASALLQNPKVIDRLITMNQNLAKDGQKIDPLWNLPKAKITSYLQYAAIPDKPDAQSSNWLAKNTWYDQGSNSLLSQRNAFFAALPPGDPNKPLAPIEYPQPNAQTTSDMNTWTNLLNTNSAQAEQFLISHQNVQNQLDNQAAYDNQVLVARGYGALRTYPTPPVSVQTKLNSINSSMTSKQKAAIYDQPDVAQWMQQDAVYNLTKGAALAQIQGNSPNSKTLGAVNDLSYDLVKNPDGTYALKYNDTQGGSSSGGAVAQTGATATGAGAYTSSSSSSSSKTAKGPYYEIKIDPEMQTSKLKISSPKKIHYKLATDYYRGAKIRAQLPNAKPMSIGKPGQI